MWLPLKTKAGLIQAAGRRRHPSQALLLGMQPAAGHSLTCLLPGLPQSFRLVL
jgi:hypothetical protein